MIRQRKPIKRTALKRSTTPLKRTPVKKKRARTRKGPLRDPKHLDFVRSLPCVCCWLIAWRAAGHIWTRDVESVYVRCLHYPTAQRTPTEAAHSGPHGIGQKAGDDTALPLCEEHHREGAEAYHKLGRGFFAHWRFDRLKLLREIGELFSL